MDFITGAELKIKSRRKPAQIQDFLSPDPSIQGACCFGGSPYFPPGETHRAAAAGVPITSLQAAWPRRWRL